MLDNLISFFKRFIERIGKGVYSVGYVILHGLGVKKLGLNYWNYEGFLLAVWVFVLGLPVGALLFGTGFFVSLWVAIVFALLLIVNFDEAMNVLYKIRKYGITNVDNNPELGFKC